ncbi:hypothetical protein PINS_up012026 [Pythium insidiosum]|nr:hypothetical protein PINS_up012026 [Pythium insidiosum]
METEDGTARVSDHQESAQSRASTVTAPGPTNTSNDVTGLQAAARPSAQSTHSDSIVVRGNIPNPGKRPASPTQRRDGDDAYPIHVPKWWRTTTKADEAKAAAKEAAKALLPASPEPLLPARWSPIEPAEQLFLSGPSADFTDASANPEEADSDDPHRPLDHAGDRQMKQLPLSAFYGPLTLAEAQAHVEAALSVRQPDQDWRATFPSPEVDAILTRFRSPSTLHAWLAALNARVISTPATGGCLYFAIHGARTRSLHGSNMTLCATHVKEGSFYKKQVCITLDQHLERMLHDGTVTFADFQRRCFQDGIPDDRTVALAKVRQYYQKIRKASIKSLAREQWGGDEEIFAAVWYLRDPIFILTVDGNGEAWLRAVWLERPHQRGPERIHHYLPTPCEAYETLRVLLQHRVTPTILVHASEHFNCLRFPEAYYHDWTSDDTTGLAMRARLDQALHQLGWYVAPRDPSGIPQAPSLAEHQLTSGSLYVPSETMSDADGTDSPQAAAEPLQPTAHALLRSINPRRRRRGPLALVWAQAERLNTAAYVEWNAAQSQPVTEEATQSLDSACRAWSASPPSFLALLRSLPYPEATISLLPPDLVRRLGNELNALAPPCGPPLFISADDPESAHDLWAQLLVLIAVALDDATDDAIIATTNWLRQHADVTVHAMHAVRRYDWTPIASLAPEILASSAPTHSDASASETARK